MRNLFHKNDLQNNQELKINFTIGLFSADANSTGNDFATYILFFVAVEFGTSKLSGWKLDSLCMQIFAAANTQNFLTESCLFIGLSRITVAAILEHPRFASILSG